VHLQAGLKLDYHPQLVVSNVGSDPTTLKGLLKAFSKGKAPSALIDGIQSDAYLPPSSDTSNDWISLFTKIHDQYIPKLPFDGNVEYGMGLAYTFVEALQRAGANPTRQSILDTIETQKLTGPGLVPFRYSKDSHAGYTGAQIAEIKNGEAQVVGKPMTTDDGDGNITTYDGQPAAAPTSGVPAS
jgi:branched-chain amino acid transport system substrate-binding protein